MTTTLTQKIQAGFSSEIGFPEPLLHFCSWVEAHNEPFSGTFEMCDDGIDVLSRWIEEKEMQKKLGVFGASTSRGLYCVWLQENGRKPIVYIGSGGFTMVLASDIKNFIILLAIGYNEPFNDDLSVAPESDEGINIKFQSWVSETFNVSIPVTGQQIIDLAVQESDEFDKWLSANCKGW